MVDESRDIVHTEWEDEEEGGGPVKTFLEHLEDLRWVLIKSGTAIVLGMVVCLLAANKIVAFLEKPLERATRILPPPKDSVVIWFGFKRIGSIKFTDLDPYIKDVFSGYFTNSIRGVLHLALIPECQDTNIVLTLRPLQKPPGPYESDAPQLIFLTPVAPFIISLKVAFFAGLVVSFPFVLYFVGEFVVPALKKKEKRFLSRALFVGIGLFILGVIFCYYVVLPIGLSAAVTYSSWLNVPVQNWMADSYFSFVVLLMGALGLAFEFPVILLGLVKLEILSYEQLRSLRKYAIVICLVIGAVLTPPDVVSQTLMAVPLFILFEISIWIARFWAWRERRTNLVNRNKS